MRLVVLAVAAVVLVLWLVRRQGDELMASDLEDDIDWLGEFR